MAGRDPIVTPLQASVHRMLDEFTYTVNNSTPCCAAEPGHLNVVLLADALRSVLAQHRPDPGGHCARCHGRRGPFSRRRGRLPCRAYLAVQLTLDSGTEEQATAEPVPRNPAVGAPPTFDP